LHARHWSSREVERRTNKTLYRSTVSMHLEGVRPIRRRHLRIYLRLFREAGGHDGRELREAWLSENELGERD
jgi:hypothetical protein